MDREIMLPIALALSFGVTVACWVHVWRSPDHLFFKIVGTLIASLPFLGPIFYWFTRLPPRLPEDAQAPPLPRGTQVRAEMTRQMFDGWRKHLNRLYGVEHSGRKLRRPRNDA
jgi:hypothetical protein